MSFIPIVAFCTMMSAGDVSPVPPYECVWVEDQNTVFTSQTGCSFRASDMAENMGVVRNAQITLMNETGYTGPVSWFTYCIERDELPDFYHFFGVPARDLPEDA